MRLAPGLAAGLVRTGLAVGLVRTGLAVGLVGLAVEAGLPDPKRPGYDDLMLLVDGANARVTVDGDRSGAPDARRLAAIIIDAYQGERA